MLFPSDFDAAKDSVSQRLQLFNDFRLPRDNTTQLYSNLQMPRNVSEKEDVIHNIRRFYGGPLMPMESSPFARERQEFFYGYDVFQQARSAMKVRDREAGLMQDEVKHFF